MAKSTPGIDVRHRRDCPAARDRDARCRCSPSYQAHVWSARERKRIRKTFRSFDEAKAWRAETLVGLRRGTMRAPSATTLREVWETWLAGARDGHDPQPLGRPVQAERPARLRDLDAPARPARARRREAVARSRASTSRTSPTGCSREGTRREHDPQHAHAAPRHLPSRARARRRRRQPRRRSRAAVRTRPPRSHRVAERGGRADRRACAKRTAPSGRPRSTPASGSASCWRSATSDVDLEAGVIRVERSWDPHAGRRSSRRAAPAGASVPIVAALRPHLAARKLRRRSAAEFFFGDRGRPFNRNALGQPGQPRVEESQALARSACTSAGTRSRRSSSPPA